MTKLLNIAVSSSLICLMGLAISLLIPVIIVLAIYDVIKDEYKDDDERKERDEEDWPNQPGRNR